MENLTLKEKLYQVQGDYYAFFRKILKENSLISVLTAFTPPFITQYFKEKKIEYNTYIYYACLLENAEDKNKVISYLINSEEYLECFVDQIDGIYSIFADIEYDVLKEFIMKISKSSKRPTGAFFSSIESEKQLLFLKETKDEEIIAWLFPSSKKEVKEAFIKEDARAYNFIERGIIPIACIIQGEIKLPKEIVESNMFFEKLKGKSLIGMRDSVNLVIKSSYTLEIETKLEDYEESMIEEYDNKTGLFKSYQGLTLKTLEDKIINSENKYLISTYFYHQLYGQQNEEKFQDFLKEETSRKLSELILDYLFKDNYYNVKINLQEILRYEDKVKPCIVDEETLNLYRLFLNIDTLTNEKKIALFHQCKVENMSFSFYENIRKYKNHSYHAIVANLYHVDEKGSQTIYELEGQPFSMIVRGINRYSPVMHNRRGCYSLIGNDNLSVMTGFDFYYGYQDIDEDFISHVFENDCHSADTRGNQTNAINRIMTKEEIGNVKGYSEIQILNPKLGNHYETLRPSYLVVFEKIEDKHKEEAARLQIPIIKIYKEKYPPTSTIPSHMLSTNVKDGYRYIRNILDEEKIRGL